MAFFHKNKCTLPHNQDRTKQPKVGSLINQGHFAPCYKSNVYVLTRLYLPK